MITKRFGQTEIQMPVLTCGSMRFQYKWQDVQPQEVPTSVQKNLEATLSKALELGINHFETARGYGSSEMQMGWFLSQLPREKLILQTKVAPTKNPSDFLRNFDQSLAYLGVETVDLLALHGLNDDEQISYALQKGGALEQALQLKDEGRIKHLGFSTHAPVPQVLPLIDLKIFEYINLHWYYIYPNHEILIQKAYQQDMGVLIISPNDKGGRLQFPSPQMSSLTTPLSPMVFNDLFTLNRSEVHTLSIGAAKPSDFDEHVTAVSKLHQAQSLLEPILKRLKQAQLDALGPQWVGPWWEGIAPYYDQPGQVNVLEIVRFWVYYQSLGLEDFAKSRYNMLGKSGHWFPGAKAGEIDIEALQASLGKHKLKNEILDILEQAHQQFDDPVIAKASGPRNSSRN